MIRVMVADDEKPARDKLTRWLSEQKDLQIVAECANGIEAMLAIEELQPDVAFLDIQMPGASGLDVAAQSEGPRTPWIVFITAFDEHAVRAFELNAVDYLLKPYDKDRLRQALERIRERIASKQHRDAAIQVARSHTRAAERLLVPEGEVLRLIDAAGIESLEADDNYVHVYAGAKRYVLRRTLQDLLAQLGEDRFVRIHKSAAVNLAAIQAFVPLFKGDYELRLSSGRQVRMSRRYKDALFERIGR